MFIKKCGILLGMGLVAQGLFTGCANNVSTEGIDEVAQQIGDVMASVDEFGGLNGTLSQYQKSFLQMENRLDPHFELPGILPNAFAASCAGGTFQGCNSQRTILKEFNNCSIGLATFDGSVSLTWGGSGSGCSLGIPPSPGANITRSPNFSVTGLRGATLEVSKEGAIGQRLTYETGLGPNARFNLSSDGIRRIFKLSNGSRLLDFTSSTLGGQPLVLTGSARAGRKLSGGVLRVKNNMEDLYCDFSPTDVTWANGCSCPISGSWQATCSDGTSSSIEITGCGSAEFTFGTETQTIAFDRCVDLN